MFLFVGFVSLLQLQNTQELYICAKALADIVIPQVCNEGRQLQQLDNNDNGRSREVVVLGR